jgi:hypothetical protein
MRGANESVSMRALHPTEAPTIKFPLPIDTVLNQSLDPSDLQRLGTRLRVAYGPVEAPLPARLAELVERLARQEQAGN